MRYTNRRILYFTLLLFVRCSRTFDDNVILFTDGMANEGISESSELLMEIRRRVDLLRDECHFSGDYVVKFSTLGTGGFLPELIYDVGQAFSSDPFYFLDDRCPPRCHVTCVSGVRRGRVLRPVFSSLPH